MLSSLVLVAVLTCPGAHAGDLVSNGDFATDTSNWRLVGRGTLQHDADGSDAAGSLDLDSGLAGNASHAIAGQCVSGVSGGQQLSFEASAKSVSGSPAYCRIALFESARDDCLWISLGAESRRTQFFGTWQNISTGSHTTAADTRSIELRLHCASSDGETSAFNVRFDDVTVTTVGLPSTIFMDDFESSDTAEWSSTTN